MKKIKKLIDFFKNILYNQSVNGKKPLVIT